MIKAKAELAKKAIAAARENAPKYDFNLKGQRQ